MKITIDDVIKAIEENGYEPKKGGFYFYGLDTDQYVVVGACAIGQAALNLKCEPNSLLSALNYATKNLIGNIIVNYNDRRDIKRYPTIAKFARKTLEPFSAYEITVQADPSVISRKKVAK